MRSAVHFLCRLARATWRRAAMSAATILLLAGAARADGVVVPSQAAEKPVRTPDQRALLRYANGVETLVIETTIRGDGLDFAWIVPLPAVPRIEESTAGLFPTLEALCAPSVRTRHFHVWAFVAAYGAFVYVVAVAHPRPPSAVRLLGAMWAGLAVATGVAIVALPQTQDGTTGSQAAEARVVERRSVGAFDTAVLDTRNAASLRAWLDANGFRAPDGIDAVVDDYAAKGWVFVASRVRRDADDDAIHAVRPLAFTFASKEPVYPMRLTGTSNESCSLDLYVLGEGRAATPSLDAVHCAGEFDGPGDIDACFGGSRELHRHASGTSVLTRLSGTVTRSEMSEDLRIAWEPFRPLSRTYSDQSVAWSWAAAAGFASLFFVAIRSAYLPASASRSSRRTAWTALAAGAGVTLAAWLVQPRLPSNAWALDRRDAAYEWVADDGSCFADAASARAWIRSRTAAVLNPYTHEPVREEDSPGNWTVDEEDGQVWLTVYGCSARTLYMWANRTCLSEP